LAAMGTLLEYLKAPPPVDAAPLDVIPFAVFPYPLPTLRVTLPQTGSEPLLVPVVAAGVSARPVVAMAAAEPQGQDGFKDRWPQSSFASIMPAGVAEWFAQNNKARSADEPTVLRGTDAPIVLHTDPAGRQSMSYAAAEPGKPLWLLTAFPNDKK
jgi:outer membrane protein, adhesin transport system